MDAAHHDCNLYVIQCYTGLWADTFNITIRNQTFSLQFFQLFKILKKKKLSTLDTTITTYRHLT